MPSSPRLGIDPPHKRQNALNFSILAAALLCLAMALACAAAAPQTGPENRQPSRTPTPGQVPPTSQPSEDARATPESERQSTVGAMLAPSTVGPMPAPANISRWNEPPPRLIDLPQWIADAAIDDYLRETGGIMSPLSAARKPHRNQDALKLLEHPTALEDCVYVPTADLRRTLADMTPAEADAVVIRQGEYRHVRMLNCLLRLDMKAPAAPVSEAELKRRYDAAVLPALIGDHMPLGHLKRLAEQDRTDARRFYRQAQREAEQCQETLSLGHWSRQTAADRILWDRAAIFDCRKDPEADLPTSWPQRDPTPFPEATPWP